MPLTLDIDIYTGSRRGRGMRESKCCSGKGASEKNGIPRLINYSLGKACTFSITSRGKSRLHRAPQSAAGTFGGRRRRMELPEGQRLSTSLHILHLHHPWPPCYNHVLNMLLQAHTNSPISSIDIHLPMDIRPRWCWKHARGAGRVSTSPCKHSSYASGLIMDPIVILLLFLCCSGMSC